MKAHLAKNWKKYLGVVIAAGAAYYGIDPAAIWALVEQAQEILGWAPGP